MTALFNPNNLLKNHVLMDKPDLIRVDHDILLDSQTLHDRHTFP